MVSSYSGRSIYQQIQCNFLLHPSTEPTLILHNSTSCSTCTTSTSTTWISVTCNDHVGSDKDDGDLLAGESADVKLTAVLDGQPELKLLHQLYQIMDEKLS